MHAVHHFLGIIIITTQVEFFYKPNADNCPNILFE